MVLALVLVPSAAGCRTEFARPGRKAIVLAAIVA